MILVDLPVRTISEANRRGHWRVHAGREAAQRGTARRFMAADKGAVSAIKLALSLGQTLYFRLVRYGPGELDTGNLAAAVKHVQDGICDAIGFDDSPRTSIEWTYGQVKNRNLPFGVVLAVGDNSEFPDLQRAAVALIVTPSSTEPSTPALRERYATVYGSVTKPSTREDIIHPHGQAPSHYPHASSAIATSNSEFPSDGNSQFPPCTEKGELPMGRRKGSKNAAHKQKKVNIEVIDRKKGETAVLYKMLDQLVAEHHEHLRQARIAIAWKHGWRADSDGRLKLGQARKTGPVDHELHEYDFVVLLNYEIFGKSFDPKDLTRLWPLLDHELMHCQVSKHADETVKTDEKGRPVWRVRGHDIEEFTDIVQRHGTSWRPELEEFISAAAEKHDRPLLRMANA